MRCVAPLRAFMLRERSASGKAAVLIGGRVRYDGRGDPSTFSSPIGDAIGLRCGSCVACLLERSRNWAVRCTHELQVSSCACFVTLTYDEEHLPYGGSLVKEHFRRFIRDVRKAFGSGIRFFGCGEYGSRWQRPHYHAILFGVDFVSDRYVSGRRSGEYVYRSPCLEALWPMGRCEIGTATFESAAYVARYVAKKLGERALEGREPEFLLMSLRPGLGERWFREFGASAVARDSVVLGDCEMPLPRYYDKLLERWSPVMFRELKDARMARRLERGEDVDRFEGRLAAMEEVLVAKLNQFSREVEV